MEKEIIYEITYSELIGLLASQLRLNALDADGVDNWQWYGESFRQVIRDVMGQNYHEGADFRDAAEYLVNIGYTEVQ